MGSGTINSCLRCSFGYQPVFIVTAATGNPNNPVCQSIPTTACTSATIVLGGLPSFLNAIFSCHSCAASTFPTIYMEYLAAPTSQLGRLIQWSFPAITSSAANPNHGFRCLAAPSTITIGQNAPSSNFQVAKIHLENAPENGKKHLILN